jgi:hypothetical protein
MKFLKPSEILARAIGALIVVLEHLLYDANVKNPAPIQRSTLRKQRLLPRKQYVPATVGSNQTATR